MVARLWSSSRLSCGERLLLRSDWNAGNSFPNTQGKDPSSQARRRKWGSSGCGRDSRDSSRALATVSCFPSRGSRALWLSLEAFPRVFPTGLSNVPSRCESILGLKSRQCRENRFPWNGLRHLGDSGQGSRLSSYKAETGLLWMWAGHSCFLSIGDGYVGEVLELQQWCEGPFGSSRG